MKVSRRDFLKIIGATAVLLALGEAVLYKENNEVSNVSRVKTKETVTKETLRKGVSENKIEEKISIEDIIYCSDIVQYRGEYAFLCYRLEKETAPSMVLYYPVNNSLLERFLEIDDAGARAVLMLAKLKEVNKCLDIRFQSECGSFVTCPPTGQPVSFKIKYIASDAKFLRGFAEVDDILYLCRPNVGCYNIESYSNVLDIERRMASVYKAIYEMIHRGRVNAQMYVCTENLEKRLTR